MKPHHRYQRLAPIIYIGLFFAFDSLSIVKAFALIALIFLHCGRRALNFFDSNAVALIAFFLIYSITAQIDGSHKTTFNMQLLFLPAALYASGRWFGYKVGSSIDLAKGFIIVGFSLASMVLLSILDDVSAFGFEGGSRSIILSEGRTEASATVLAGSLVILLAYTGTIFSQDRKLGIGWRITIFFLSIIAIFASLRLGTRTSLALAAMSIIVGLSLNMRHLRLTVFITIIAAVSSSLYLLYAKYSSHFDLLFYLQDRLSSDEHGVSTAGGRTDKWINSLELIVNNPLGWSLDINGYSHNLWLDVARNGGWPSLIFVTIITAMAIRTFIRSIKNNHHDSLYTTITISLGLCCLALFFVEPILDGFVYVFSAFCCFWGIAQSWALKITLNPISRNSRSA